MVPAQEWEGDGGQGLTPSFRDRALTELVSLLGWAYLHFVGLTSRIRVHMHPGSKAVTDGKRPCVFAFWHRYQLMMCYERRGRGIKVLVSRSGDGEFIARTLHRFGYDTSRGSSSRGGAAALMGLLDAVAAGGQAGVTPDGPKGPFRSVQPGLALLSQKTGAPILPCGWAGTRVKTLRSWDRFLIPKPFGRYVFVFGEPLVISAEETGAEEKIRAALDRAAQEAEDLLRGQAPEGDVR